MFNNDKRLVQRVCDEYLCDEEEYYDSVLKRCENCEDKFDNCEECNNDECLECEEDYKLQGGECVEERRMLKSLVNDTAEN